MMFPYYFTTFLCVRVAFHMGITLLQTSRKGKGQAALCINSGGLPFDTAQGGALRHGFASQGASRRAVGLDTPKSTATRPPAVETPPNTGRWLYTATQAVPQGSNVRIAVTASGQPRVSNGRGWSTACYIDIIPTVTNCGFPPLKKRNL